MKIEAKAVRWMLAAKVMAKLDPAGALHIIVSDGNVDDEHLDACEADPRITPLEYEFLYWMRGFSPDERAAIYELTVGTEA